MKHFKPKWKHYRVIHSIYPPQNLFDTVDDKDAFLLAELEGQTSDRLMRWQEFMPAEDARFGDGWGAVMASFCYISSGRFNTWEFGCYYAADSIHTALKEWSYHATKIWLEFQYHEDANAIVRSYTGKILKPLADVTRNNRAHAKNTYAYSSQLGKKLRDNDEFGVYYRSARNKGGYCVALFKPEATSPVSQSAHYTVKWDGYKFTEYAEVKEFKPL